MNGKRIQKFSLNGKLLAKTEFQECEFSDCAIDYYENIWVPDKKNGYIYKFDKDLKHIAKVTNPKNKKFVSPRAITIWKRFGQVFVLEEEAINYFWIGVDGYIDGCYPSVFDPKERGTTISLYLTEPAHISVEIYKNKNKIRSLLPAFYIKPFEHNIVWDGKDDKNKVVEPGEYRIKIILEPTYSSKGYFKKKLETKVICK
jgi:hypothetical protein